MNHPLVVFPHKFLAGVDGLEDGLAINRGGLEVEGVRIRVDGEAAWSEVYPDDAHCVAYSIPGLIGLHPRINKPALPRLIELGREPLHHWAIVDVDNPGHVAWEGCVHTHFTGLMQWLRSCCGPLAATASVYLSAHGYRLVWPLDSPIPVSQVEPRLRGLIHHLHEHGIEADPLVDWTRMFRMPRVVRMGRRQQLPMEITA